MNQIKRLFIVALLLTFMAGAGAVHAAPDAQQPPPPADIYSFVQLGLSARTLTSPHESHQFFVTLPRAWKIEPGSAIKLNVSVSSLQPLLGGATTLGKLQFNLNGHSLGSFDLTKIGQQTISVLIPATSLALLSDQRLALNTTLTSDLPIQIQIRDDSTFTLIHSAVPLDISLSNLPAPIYEGSFLTDAALLVLPDSPSAQELRAALIVAAGLGRMSGNHLNLGVRRSSDLTSKEYSAAHLIFVGKPVDLPLLRTVTLPATISAAGFTAPTMGADDGVVQMAISPWNAEKAVLVVGGNSNAAVLKAAQALSARDLLTISNPNLALIAAVQPETVQEEPPPVRSFEYLGYVSTIRTARLGQTNLPFVFDVPRNRVADEESSLTLYFNHSAMLDYSQSGITVLLNASEIGSVRFSDTSTSLSTIAVSIPSKLVRAGRNTITVRMSLVPATLGATESDLWANIWPSSFITLPLTQVNSTPNRSINLDLYPDIFTSDPNLADIAFVLAPSDPASWEVAAQIAADLGNQVTGNLIDLDVAYGDAVSPEVRNQRNVLIIGLPNQIKLITELKDDLPAPFDMTTNQAYNRDTQVVFRTAVGQDVGYAELLRAPWDPQRLVLAILGSSPQGLVYARDVFTSPDLRTRLGGTFATIVGKQIFISGAHLANLASSTTSAATSPTTVPAEAAVVDSPFPNATAPQGPPSQIIALGLSVLLIAIVVGGLLSISWFYRRFRNRSRIPS